MINAHQRWPDEFATRYRQMGYWTGELLGDLLRDSARRHADRTAVVGGGTRWTYAELDARADALAAGFLRIGFRPGERVLVQLPNRPDFIATVFGLFRAGILPVYCLPAHRRAEIGHFAAASEAVGYIVADEYESFDYHPLAAEIASSHSTIRHVLVDGDPGTFTALSTLVEMGRTAPAPPTPPPDPSSVAFLQLSGGSTGLSKLIPRTHDDYLYSVRESARICGLGPDSVYLAALPIAHNYPMSSPGFLGVLYAGGTVVLSPSARPEDAFPLIAWEGVTITALVPPLVPIWLRAVRNTTLDLSSLEVVQVGGAKLAPELARRIGPELGAKLQQVFGMAEGLVNYTRLDDPEEVIVNTQGRPISPADEVRVVDDDGRSLPPDVPGQLLTRGPYTIRDYYNDAEANARAFDADGFYRTGDLVSRSADGYLTVLGRATDQINRGGEKISPAEVEDHLLAHPAVHDVAVVGVADAFLGERSCAFVIAQGDAPRSSELRGWIRERGLAAFKIPDRFVFVESFPETGVGKTSRRDLRAALRERLATAARDESATDATRN